MTPVRLEPAALRSRVKHSTTEPLRSLNWEVIKYHILVIELSMICLNTGPEDRLNCWGSITLAQSTTRAIPSVKLHLVCLDKFAKDDE